MADRGPPAKPEKRKSPNSEQVFRLLVESVRDYAIYVLDPSGYVATWNRGAERLKGYRAEEIIGQHFSVFYPLEDKQAGKAERELEAALRDGRAEDEAWRVRKDGSRFWANVVVTPLYDPDGTLRGFAKVTRDLTERRRAEDDRVRLAKTEEALRLRDEFLSIASHELRTPLNALSLYLQGTKRLNERDNREALGDSLEKAIRQVARLTELVDGLLDASRITEGRLQLNRKPLDLADLVADAVENVRGVAEVAGSTIRVSPNAKPIAGSFDQLRMEQLLTNLLHNAIKYGRGRPIDVGISVNGVEASVTIADEGIGIAERDQERIFSRFERAASVRHYGGLGLGLYICKSIVEAHGGSISVESNVGEGSKFEVRLPITKPS
jgi:PAS domain S-box-containing protein